MHSIFAATLLLSLVGVCFLARIPVPEKIPRFSLSNVRGSPNIRGQPPEGPWEPPVFDHPPFFDNEDEMFERNPSILPPKRINPFEYDFSDEDFGIPPVPDFDTNEVNHEEPDKRIDESPKENPEPIDDDSVHGKNDAIPANDKEIPAEDDDSDKHIPEDDDSDKHIPEDDDSDKHMPEDDDSDKHMPDDDKKPPEVEPESDLDEDILSRPGTLPIGSPFFDIDQMRRYFELVERAMDKVFRQTIEEAQVLNGTFANTTEEEIDVDGHTYKVVKSIIRSGDHNSSIFIEAVETTLESNRTKRSNWYSEEAHTSGDYDP